LGERPVLGRGPGVVAASAGMTPPMGLTSWAAFSKDGEQDDGHGRYGLARRTVNPVISVALDQGLEVTVDGDFAMYEDDFQTVLKALRASDIHIVAIHSHMSMESPKVVFLHYWGIGSTTELAKALKSALDTQRRAP
jgi:hypothetical protein